MLLLRIFMLFLVLITKNTVAQPTQPAIPQVTIWVHGTKQFFSKFFCKNFFYNRIGLHPAHSFEPKYNLRTIADCLAAQNAEIFPFQHLYFFGWDGRLSFAARQQASEHLYQAIKNLRQEYYQQYHCYPFLRLITHSHGGNVALFLADFFTAHDNFAIDELILLACPVQAVTEPNAHRPMFTKIYSIFSKSDSLQILDPQGLYYWHNYMNGTVKEKIESSFFSQRTFIPDKKIVQIMVKFNYTTFGFSRDLMHVEFLFPDFLNNLSAILAYADKLQNNATTVIEVKINK